MIISPDRTVGSMVAEDYRIAAVFTAHGIDFCCHGGRTMVDACASKGIDPALLEHELHERLARTEPSNEDPADWTLGQVADHIEAAHHAYVRSRIPLLQQYLEKLCNVHGGRHPELHLVGMELHVCARAMAEHMQKEELVLFPFIRAMERRSVSGEAMTGAPSFSIRDAIRTMEHEHSEEGDRFRRIRDLTHGYEQPADGCSTYSAAMALLGEFEDDLHLHIHLENNILFPRAQTMDGAMTPAR